MTVRELIDQLQRCPPDRDVFIQTLWRRNGEYQQSEICEIACVRDCVIKDNGEEYIGIIAGLHTLIGA